MRLILRGRRRGLSFRAIAAELTDAGHIPRQGLRWYASTTRGVWARRTTYRPLLAPAP